MMLTQFITTWAKDSLGLLLKPHQLVRIEKEISMLLEENNLELDDFIEQINQKNAPLIGSITDIVTIQESYFFRDKSLFSYLEHHLLPQIIKDKQLQDKKSIHIWSAGCSHGEEIYSIAILLHKLITNRQSWKIYLYATDINNAALKIAEKAEYTKGSLRASSKEFISTYFDTKNKRLILNPHLKQDVYFECYNISSSPPPKQKFDIILCRNVFIYLTQASIKNALDTFHESLEDNGKLFLAPSDLVSHIPSKLKQTTNQNIVQLEKPSSSINTQEKTASAQNLHSYSYANKQKRSKIEFGQISYALSLNQFEQVIKLCDKYIKHNDKSALLYRYKSQALISLGDNETAKVWLKKSHLLHKSDPITLYLIAIVNIDNPSIAKENLKLAITLNTFFLEAYYQLGLILLREKAVKEGLQYLIKSRDIAKTKPSSKTLLSSKDTISTFLKNISEDIHYYQGYIHE